MSDENWPFPEPGMAAAMADFPDGPGYVALMPEPVETVPPRVPKELPPLSDDECTAIFMGIKRAMDALQSRDRTHWQIAMGHFKSV